MAKPLVRVKDLKKNTIYVIFNKKSFGFNWELELDDVRIKLPIHKNPPFQKDFLRYTGQKLEFLSPTHMYVIESARNVCVHPKSMNIVRVF